MGEGQVGVQIPAVPRWVGAGTILPAVQTLNNMNIVWGVQKVSRIIWRGEWLWGRGQELSCDNHGVCVYVCGNGRSTIKYTLINKLER